VAFISQQNSEILSSTVTLSAPCGTSSHIHTSNNKIICKITELIPKWREVAEMNSLAKPKLILEKLLTKLQTVYYNGL